MDDGVVDAELADKGAFFLCGITNIPKNAEKIQAGNSVFVTELLHRAGEDFGDSQRCCNRR